MFLRHDRAVLLGRDAQRGELLLARHQPVAQLGHLDLHRQERLAQGGDLVTRARLRRLGVDYVDKYIIHRFDWETPIEETLEALHDVVKAGKARYLGASNLRPHQLVKMHQTQIRMGWSRWKAKYDALKAEEAERNDATGAWARNAARVFANAERRMTAARSFPVQLAHSFCAASACAIAPAT